LKFSYSSFILRSERKYLDSLIEIYNINDFEEMIKQFENLASIKESLVYEDSKILESFVIDYKPQWPMNLIFSQKNILKYKLIFRQLLLFKFNEKKLGEVWAIQQSFKDLNQSFFLKPSYILRDKMMNFIKSIIYYFINEVIEPEYQSLLLLMQSVNDFNEMIKIHNDFLDKCIKQCLLENFEILDHINEILQTCLVFSNIILKYYEEGKKQINNIKINQEKRKKYSEEKQLIIEDVFKTNKFNEHVEKFNQLFVKKLENVLLKINKM
jgi:gamma-tubulin complex component 2